MKQQREPSGWVYLLRTGWHYKIGKTKDVKTRVSQLQTSSPYRIELVCAVFCEDMSHTEACFHKDYDEYRVSGEWFELPPDLVDAAIKQMLFDTEVLCGDVGDDSNWLIYMMHDYAVKRSLLKPFCYFPDREIEEGWCLKDNVAPCLCKNGGRVPSGATCSWCGGTGFLMTEDIEVLCGRRQATLENARRLTGTEARLVTRYMKWWKDSEET